eukprot:gnl/TRDRNA2_/TRDRNA2_130994_c0_seq1.p1 gnl/TRDRNA2_/TRDRNA2_130994_c0~~gnl/TRDRNA2_/TRDRNA2_130994_c0_seq1.p1  ORF type:complete len:186 (+),score=16.95 gnl/TRDRNA2_/TRDRNA2_130994_c0_seq1:94-651(+)
MLIYARVNDSKSAAITRSVSSIPQEIMARLPWVPWVCLDIFWTLRLFFPALLGGCLAAVLQAYSISVSVSSFSISFWKMSGSPVWVQLNLLIWMTTTTSWMCLDVLSTPSWDTSQISLRALLGLAFIINMVSVLKGMMAKVEIIGTPDLPKTVQEGPAIIAEGSERQNGPDESPSYCKDLDCNRL